MWRRADLARVCESINKQTFPLRRIVRQMGMGKYVLEDAKKMMKKAGLSEETKLDELAEFLGIQGEDNITRLGAIRKAALNVYEKIDVVKEGLDHEQQLAIAISSKTSNSSVSDYIKLFEGQVTLYEENALRHVEVDKIEKRVEQEKNKNAKDKDQRTRGGKRGGGRGRGASNGGSERNYNSGQQYGQQYGHNNNFAPVASSSPGGGAGMGGGFGGNFNAPKSSGPKMCHYNCGQTYTPSHQCPNKPTKA
jgi:hypothetical protein